MSLATRATPGLSAKKGLSIAWRAMSAAETDAARCYEILETEIREALTGVADSISEGDRLSGDDRESTVGPVSLRSQ